MVNYTVRYICFMKTLEEDKEDNIWLEYYIYLTEINQRLVNTIINKNFDLI